MGYVQEQPLWNTSRIWLQLALNVSQPSLTLVIKLVIKRWGGGSGINRAAADLGWESLQSMVTQALTPSPLKQTETFPFSAMGTGANALELMRLKQFLSDRMSGRDQNSIKTTLFIARQC